MNIKNLTHKQLASYMQGYRDAQHGRPHGDTADEYERAGHADGSRASSRLRQRRRVYG